MTDISPLSTALTTAVLAHLNVPQTTPSIQYLEHLIGGYTRTVPWESAFRIVKRQETEETGTCPRWPDEFWEDTLTRGGGGTCFESNLAFFSLLRALGFAGYLTINNMGETIGCHTAIIIHLDGAKWLVDAGLPVYQPVQVNPDEVTQRSTPFLNFTVKPDGGSRYQIERAPHPVLNAFTLLDKPIDAETYLAATTADYGEKGFFLDRVLINKVINDRVYRFNSEESTTQLEHFWRGEKFVDELPDDGGTAVARHFGMDETVVRKALKIVNVATRRFAHQS
jgi:hypothetical protein